MCLPHPYEGCISFDDVAMGTPGNVLFGCADVPERHFTDFSCRRSTAGGALAGEHQVKMMNPMNYIDDPQVIKAKHCRICHGSVDRDTWLAIPAMLTAAPCMSGVDAELKHPWGIPCAGDCELPELFDWIDVICK